MMLLDETHEHLLEDARDLIWRLLAEGVFDPYILKAIFFGGGMGSGKGFIIGQMVGTGTKATEGAPFAKVIKHHSLTGLGLKIVGVDDIFMRDVHRAGLDPATILSTDRGAAMHKAARKTRTRRQKLFLRGRLGLILDGTAQNPISVHKKKKMLESIGYDCSMMMVKTDLDVALKRNAKRERKAEVEDVIHTHAEVKKAITLYKQSFGHRYHEHDNTKFAAPGEMAALTKGLHKLTLKILQEPLENPIGKQWLRDQTDGMPPSMLKKVTWLGKKRGA
jgi:hypothetical protein